MEKCCGGAVNAYECIATTLSQVSQVKLRSWSARSHLRSQRLHRGIVCSSTIFVRSSAIFVRSSAIFVRSFAHVYPIHSFVSMTVYFNLLTDLWQRPFLNSVHFWPASFSEQRPFLTSVHFWPASISDQRPFLTSVHFHSISRICRSPYSQQFFYTQYTPVRLFLNVFP